MNEYMTTYEAAIKWGISNITVRGMCNKGRVPAEKTGRDWFIPIDTPKPVDRRYVEAPIRNRRKSERK